LNIRDDIYKGWAHRTEIRRQYLGNYCYFPLTPGRYMYDNDVTYETDILGDNESRLKISSDTNIGSTRIIVDIGSIAFIIRESDNVIL